MGNSNSGLSKFAVKTPTDAAASPKAAIVKTRGKNDRVAIAVRLNQADWHRATELSMREGTSLQRLIVAGLNELMSQRGLEPLSGD